MVTDPFATPSPPDMASGKQDRVALGEPPSTPRVHAAQSFATPS